MYVLESTSENSENRSTESCRIAKNFRNIATVSDSLKNVLAGKKEEEVQVIRYIKGGKAILLVELVFQKESTFNKYLQNGITLEYMYFKMVPKRTTKRIIQCFNCQQ